ncbi:MAG: PhnE/PtxC family ABC transporter permease [Acidimicrobiia bacterium]
MAEAQKHKPDTPRRAKWKRSLLLVLAVVIGVVVYAYGFEVTGVDLGEIRSETRRVQLVRVLRSLARPEVFTYERIDTNTDTPFFMPCPPGGFTPPEAGPDERQIVVDPPCSDPGDTVTVYGFNFSPNARGTLTQVPPDGDLNLRLDNFLADENGNFVLTVNTRERPDERQQWIRAITREPVGSIFSRVEVPTGKVDPETGEEIVVKSPRVSKAALDTWDRIIETVFMAFLATTLGVLVAVPLSFMAARNLMKDIAIPVTKLAMQIIALPLGVGIGIVAAGWAQQLSSLLTRSIVLVVLGLVLIPFAMWFGFRWGLPPVEEIPPGPGLRAARIVVLIVAALGGILVLFLLADLLTTVGHQLSPRLVAFDFIARFVASVGDILAAIITLITAVASAGVLMNMAGRLGMWVRGRLSTGLIQLLNLPLAVIAGAGLAVIVGLGIGWLYRFTDPMTTIWIPAMVGGTIGLVLAARAFRKETVNVGLTLYYIARTIFNTLRSIEPLVMVIVFAVWVGIGAFAGTLALATHTIAALAKLYSEQVESILPGPIEAVKASGATRMQTVVYAVLPQVVPPYISFTLYRWDINVRMSTVIGFAGGGGIGFLLQQNIRFLNYPAASVNMLAIAVVVASMDYLSSRIRERIV